MNAVWLGGIVVLLASSAWLWRVWEKDLQRRARLRAEDRNIHAQVTYRLAGFRWYPHVLGDGSVRWYSVDHDPLEL